MEDKSDLLQYAREYATTQDLYVLLGVDFDDDKSKIHSKWRKASVKYHPDKTGAAFDPEKWELLERARDVLSSPEARGAYDAARAETMRREQQRTAMDAKRRAMVEDLEARERGVKRKHSDGGNKNAMSEAERRRLAEAGRRRMEERRRLMEEAEERDRERERQRIAREQKERSAQEGPSTTRTTAEEENAEDRTDKPSKHSEIPDAGARESHPLETAATNGEAKQDGDEYDERIADIERRLQDMQARKVDKKARKAAEKKKKKAHRETHHPQPEEPQAAGDTPAAAAAAAATTTTAIPIHAPTHTADTTTTTTPAPADATAAPRAPIFRPAATSEAAAAASDSGGKTKFASTMARLRAAQAAKEAKKKKDDAAAMTT